MEAQVAALQKKLESEAATFRDIQKGACTPTHSCCAA
jgi:hypothetical protein